MNVTLKIFILLCIIICLEGRGGGGARGGGRGFSAGRSASVSSGVKSAAIASPHISPAGSSNSFAPQSSGSVGGGVAKSVSGNTGVVRGSSSGIYPIPFVGGVHNSELGHRNLTKSNENFIG
uniref:Uncharacterized protein n=1 Tax=Panagrolaimus sp. PS1159 TaxID=55785 RepID=A0AC35GT42_9BILA